MAELVVVLSDSLKNDIVAEMPPELTMHFEDRGDGTWQAPTSEFLMVITRHVFSAGVESAIDSAYITKDLRVPRGQHLIGVDNDGILYYAGSSVDIAAQDPGKYLIVAGEFHDTTGGVYAETVLNIKQTDLTRVAHITPQIEAALKSVRVFTFMQMTRISPPLWQALGGAESDYFEMIDSAYELHATEIGE